MGGTFDPIHNGHIQMAREAKVRLGLDEVWLMPAGDPPHKEGLVTPGALRLAMVELGIQGEPGLVAKDFELGRPGKSFTVDTLRALHREYDGEFVFILGGDMLVELPRWREPEALARLCGFGVFPRGDVFGEALDEAAALVAKGFGARVQVMEYQPMGISSTEIRERVGRGALLGGWVPGAVARYIDERRLYDPPRLYNLEQMKARLREMLSPGRFAHVLGTMGAAEDYARRFGVDPEKARVAGLLHDVARDLPLEEMQRVGRDLGVQVEEDFWENRDLLHAPVGAAMIRQLFGVLDPEVFQAIWAHNTGSTAMSPLDRVIFLMDKIEPSRRIYPGLKEMRILAEKDLTRAIILFMENNLVYMESIGKKVHPRSLEALEALKWEVQIKQEDREEKA